MSVTIRSGNIDAFFRVPFEIYRSLPYVSPMKSDLKRFLDPRANPLFQSPDDLGVFTCHRDGRPLGRITAHVHRASNIRHGTNAAHFGYFDCADDPEVALALLNTAQDWARARGFDEIKGNFNLTAMQMTGVCTGGFDAPVYSDCMWSPPWLESHLAASGFERLFPMTTHEVALPAPQTPPRPCPDGLHHAPISRRTLPDRLEDARQILNASFDRNPMFVPVSEAEYMFQAKDLKLIFDPRLSVVLHDGQSPAAALLCIPDLNPMLRAMGSRLSVTAPWHFLKHRLTNRRALLIYYGVRPDLHRRGVTPYMLDHVMRQAQGAGYDRIGVTWIAEGNPASLRQMEKIGARPLQTLHLFRKALR
ncbi:N-acetyltransferase family protein [Tropicibacter sp. S64]|uniref:GNAT family N-acetyltransferase n=1 Tax=Tropicibacter sp. S64 TaxID=3415122 RepID=UPI003C79864D